MNTTQYIINAFTTESDGGNPAAVCVLEHWPENAAMQKRAADNGLSETAFIVPEGDGYAMRWFTPEVEIDLCGHATLAAAHLLLNCSTEHLNEAIFKTRSGILKTVRRDGLLRIDLPSRKPTPIPILPSYSDIFKIEPLAAHAARDLILEFESEETIRKLEPDLNICKTITDYFCIITTAPGDHGKDFVSRVFAPNAGINEDPVTGSAHCSLVPLWSERFQKKKLKAAQLSSRGGNLYCLDRGTRVELGGYAVLTDEVSIEL